MRRVLLFMKTDGLQDRRFPTGISAQKNIETGFKIELFRFEKAFVVSDRQLF